METNQTNANVVEHKSLRELLDAAQSAAMSWEDNPLSIPSSDLYIDDFLQELRVMAKAGNTLPELEKYITNINATIEALEAIEGYFCDDDSYCPTTDYFQSKEEFEQYCRNYGWPVDDTLLVEPVDYALQNYSLRDIRRIIDQA